jgi:hypothetical protein
MGGVVLHDSCGRGSGCSRSLDGARGAGGGFVVASGAVAAGYRSWCDSSPQMHSLGSALVVVNGLLAGAEYISNVVVLMLENVATSSCCVERPYLHQMHR